MERLDDARTSVRRTRGSVRGSLSTRARRATAAFEDVETTTLACKGAVATVRTLPELQASCGSEARPGDTSNVSELLQAPSESVEPKMLSGSGQKKKVMRSGCLALYSGHTDTANRRRTGRGYITHVN